MNLIKNLMRTIGFAMGMFISTMLGQRTPLTIAISKDDSQSWEKVKNRETDPDGWCCYTAIHFDQSNVLLTDCAANQQAGTDLWATELALLSLKNRYQ